MEIGSNLIQAFRMFVWWVEMEFTPALQQQASWQKHIETHLCNRFMQYTQNTDGIGTKVTVQRNIAQPLLCTGLRCIIEKVFRYCQRKGSYSVNRPEDRNSLLIFLPEQLCNED
jgi:hypothetical protein